MKVMSKMGISTYQSYCGAQIFDAVGLARRFRRRSTSPAPPPRIERRRPRRDRRGDGEPPHGSLRRRPDAERTNARGRRRIRLPHPRRGPRLVARDRRGPAACGARQHARTAYQASSRAMINEQTERLHDDPRPVPHPHGGRATAASPSPSTRSSPPPPSCKRFATGAMSYRLDLARGAHDAGASP